MALTLTLQASNENLRPAHDLTVRLNFGSNLSAVNMMGFNAGPLRMPLTEMEEGNKKILRQAMEDAGIKVTE